MKSICIKNLRSLSDTGQMNLKPINILVGGNSSGKSTFLRLFPLIKQSLRKTINGPILWAGDDEDYVDFGSFNEAVNNSSDKKEIKFKFTFDMSMSDRYGLIYEYNDYVDDDKPYNVDTEFTLAQCKDKSFDYISEITINIFGHKIFMKFNEDKSICFLEINDNECKISEDDMDKMFLGREIPLFDIPLFGLQYLALKQYKDIMGHPDSNNMEMYDKTRTEINYLFFKNIVKAKLKNKKINERKESDYNIEKYDDERYSNKDVNELLMMYYIPNIYDQISRYLYQYFRNVYYIAPVRATAERYYRLRNITVNEVDCRGKNLAVFLNSLEKEQFKRFQQWTKDNLEFFIETSLSEGHVSLKIRKNGSKQAVNLSDTGFGYSQILPIITQLWYIATRKELKYFMNNNVPVTIAIEQPELHLHPALQAKLVDVIVKIMKSPEGRKNINFIIETHSETMINRFANLIYKDKVEEDKIAIFIFDKDDDKDTQVKFGEFDSEGYLSNWPVGFFEPEEV